MINSLTSLRFFFALMVFGSHCYVIDSFFDAHVFKEGYVGVGFFFVLSGFIISYNYQHRMEQKEVGKRTFWVARFARIYPMHWLTLFFGAILPGYVAASGALDWTTHFLASFTLTQAFVPREDYFFSFNSPSWSLCCEQLFYLCFPFMVTLAKDYKRLLAVFLIMAVIVPTGMYLTPEEDIKGYWYVNPITRFPDFILGMLLFRLYEYLRKKEISKAPGSVMEITSVVVFIAFYMYAAKIPEVYRYSVYYWLPIAIVLISFALQKGILSRILNNRFLIIGGEISYSFYLIHLFILWPCSQKLKASGMDIEWYYSAPVLFVIITFLSLVSYRYFEKPMNKKAKFLLNRQQTNKAL